MTRTSERLLEQVERNEIQADYVDEPPDTMTEENWARFVRGEITWSQLEGMTIEEAYAIAELGYGFFENGRYSDARTIFEGLVLGNPHDAYFHTVLGAVYARLDLYEPAIEEYSVAIELDPESIANRLNRGELLLQHGEFEYALEDLRAAIDLDPEAADPSGIRARALVVAADEIVRKALAGEVTDGPEE